MMARLISLIRQAFLARRDVRAVSGFLLLLLLLVPPVAAQGGAGYLIGPGDVIEVSLAGVPDYRSRVRVQEDGTVLLPYAESVRAADRTALQLGQDIARKLAATGYYVRPQVIVDIVSYSSRYVTVLGAVASPGLVPVDRSYRLSEILARVGGTRLGGADHVVLTRAGAKEMRLPVETLATAGGASDPQVEPGDKIFVPEAESFFIYGQVNAPGAYALKGGMTIRQAIARGGGLTQLGTEKRVKLIRNGKEMKGAKLEMPVAADDVVVVGERYF